VGEGNMIIDLHARAIQSREDPINYAVEVRSDIERIVGGIFLGVNEIPEKKLIDSIFEIQENLDHYTYDEYISKEIYPRFSPILVPALGYKNFLNWDLGEGESNREKEANVPQEYRKHLVDAIKNIPGNFQGVHPEKLAVTLYILRELTHYSSYGEKNIKEIKDYEKTLYFFFMNAKDVARTSSESMRLMKKMKDRAKINRLKTLEKLIKIE
jgi:hypothetical protein